MNLFHYILYAFSSLVCLFSKENLISCYFFTYYQPTNQPAKTMIEGASSGFICTANGSLQNLSL